MVSVIVDNVAAEVDRAEILENLPADVAVVLRTQAMMRIGLERRTYRARSIR